MLTKVSTENNGFNHDYLEAQITAHPSVVALFATAAKSEADPGLKAFAVKHLPQLQMHLDMVKKVKVRVD